MEKENSFGLMEVNMMVNGKIIKNMDMELIQDKTMKNMKDIIKMIKNMDKE